MQLFLALGPILGRELWQRKSVLREMNCRSQNFWKFLGSETRKKLRPAIHCAGNRDGIDSTLRHFVFALAAQKLDGKFVGSPTARVQPVQFPRLGFVNDGEKMPPHSV